MLFFVKQLSVPGDPEDILEVVERQTAGLDDHPYTLLGNNPGRFIKTFKDGDSVMHFILRSGLYEVLETEGRL